MAKPSFAFTNWIPLELTAGTKVSVKLSPPLVVLPIDLSVPASLEGLPNTKPVELFRKYRWVFPGIFPKPIVCQFIPPLVVASTTFELFAAQPVIVFMKKISFMLLSLPWNNWFHAVAPTEVLYKTPHCPQANTWLVPYSDKS